MGRFLLTLIFILFSGACAQTRSLSEPARPLVILVSIDGFRADYIDRGAAPTVARLAAEGVRARMRPSFPSVTFPNHYTLITGRRPDRNGIVNNRMEDPERPGVTFSLSDPAIAADPIWWADATPLWVSAERQGVHTGTMFWPGSDFEIEGVRPSRWRQFDQTLPGFARVDALLAWLDAPPAERPVFLTLYFDLVDSAGHRFGPDAPETSSALAEVDAAIARLVAGLDARGLEANLVIVGDHGMADVADDRIIDLDALAPADAAHVVWASETVGVVPLPGHEAQVQGALLGRNAHGECWRKSEIPARFHYGAHRRVPPIVCLADLGWRYRSAQIPPWSGITRGAHGFDPEAPEMATNFIAHGPAFRRGATLAPFDNVSVYPLVARLIGVTPEPNDGTLADTAAALKE